MNQNKPLRDLSEPVKNLEMNQNKPLRDLSEPVKSGDESE